MTIGLSAGEFALHLAPQTGGAIASFTWRGVELLRPVRDARLLAQRGRKVAAYPLLPYVNRIAQARFVLDGETFVLGRNYLDSPHCIHGNGWMRPWAVVQAGSCHASLTLVHAPPYDPAAEWPFAYMARQDFALSADGLKVTLTLRNTDRRAWPAGLGLHPYVARMPGTTLAFEADTVWLTGPDALPSERVAVPPAMDFDRPGPIGDDPLDVCFAGWGGIARLSMPAAGFTLVIESGPPLDHVQIYTPAGKDYCGVEPVSTMPDAINRMDRVSDQGLVMLQPGAELTARITFRLEDHADQLQTY